MLVDVPGVRTHKILFLGGGFNIGIDGLSC